MKGHGEKLGRKKEQAILALVTARNTEEAAKSIGVSAKTLLRWQKLPEFERAYREARVAGFRQSTARLQQASSPAVTTLLKTLPRARNDVTSTAPVVSVSSTTSESLMDT